MELQFVFQCWPARGIISQVYMSIQKNHCFEKPPLSQDHVRFTTQCSENMRSSWHNERVRVGTWFQIFFPQILLFTLVSHIWKAESYQGLWPGTRGNASLRAVLAIAASMPRSRSNVDEQMEKCVTRPGTEKNQKLALEPFIGNFQWSITRYSHGHFTFQEIIKPAEKIIAHSLSLVGKISKSP